MTRTGYVVNAGFLKTQDVKECSECEEPFEIQPQPYTQQAWKWGEEWLCECCDEDRREKMADY